MKYYELTYLITPDIDEEEATGLYEKFISFLQGKEAILDMNKEKIKKIELAYPIKKKNSAWLASANFYLTPERINELEGEIKKEKNILRYLIINKKKISTHSFGQSQRNKKVREKNIISKMEN